MKIISEIVDSPLYTAVFALNTPAIDHSGISHLTEHMVFRGSTKYPANHELFVINTLLPANVNASTQNGVTFYFVSSKDKSLFLLLLDYVYAGLVQIDYPLAEFLLERDGVSHQELKMYEKHPDYAVFAAVLRGDSSFDNVSHHGGFSDTMGQNTIEDLVLYKQRFYQQEQFTLYLNGPEHVDFTSATSLDNTPQDQTTGLGARTSNKALQRDQGKLAKNMLSYSQKPNYALPPLADNSSSEEALDTVITWRIHAAYRVQCDAQIETINSRLDDAERIIIEEEINHRAHFALRAITKRPDTTIRIVVNTLKNADIQQDNYVQADSKHQSEQINRCMQAYLEQHINLPPALPLDTYLLAYQKSSLYPIQAVTIEKPSNKANAFESSICNLAKACLSLAHVSALPRLFQNAVPQDTGIFHIVDNDHWLYELRKLDKGKLQNLIVSPEFWSPRLNGECYAMGLGVLEDRLFVYGVQDIDAPAKERFITKILASIC